MIIYLIRNKINGKSYVGQTIRSVKQRWAEHVKSAQRSVSRCGLQAAIRKYGHDKFDVSILQECSSLDELSDAERSWVAKLDTYKNGYNLTTGGDQRPGFNRSTKTRKLISDKIRLKYATDHTYKEHVVAAMYGRKQSPEMIEKRRMRGQKNWNFGRFGSAHPCGGPKSEEHKKKISEGKKNKHMRHSIESLQKMSVAHSLPVAALDDCGNVVLAFKSSHATKFAGFSALQVNRVTRGVAKRHKNLSWKKFIDLSWDQLILAKQLLDKTMPTVLY